jgi:hypothetical protein
MVQVYKIVGNKSWNSIAGNIMKAQFYLQRVKMEIQENLMVIWHLSEFRALKKNIGNR